MHALSSPDVDFLSCPMNWTSYLPYQKLNVRGHLSTENILCHEWQDFAASSIKANHVLIGKYGVFPDDKSS
jgi:hypothetical protein